MRVDEVVDGFVDLNETSAPVAAAHSDDDEDDDGAADEDGDVNGRARSFSGAAAAPVFMKLILMRPSASTSTCEGTLQDSSA